MKTKRILLVLSLVMCGVIFSTVPVEATLIAIEIEAVVVDVRDQAGYLEGKIKPGDIITGWYTYDTSTPDSNPLSQVGDYEHRIPTCGIFLSAGRFNFETGPTDIDFLLEIVNDSISGGLHDAYGLISYNNLPLSNGTLVDEISWWLGDLSATALSSISLPTTPPSLPDWETNVLHLYGFKDTFHIFAEVTSAIPEPATILLFGVGALILRLTMRK